jgi:hypothetical protein
LSVAYYFSACCLNIKNRSAGCSQSRKTDYNRDGGSAKKCDVLSLLVKRYGLNVEDLIKPFIKGFQIGLKEKHG